MLKDTHKKSLLAVYLKTLISSSIVISSVWLSTPLFAQAEQVVDEPAVIEEQTINDVSADIKAPLPLEQIRVFADVFTRIKNSYVEPVSDEQLLDYAISGMLNGLDPHSAYLKQERYDDLNEGTTGKFGGLGIEVVLENGFVKVVAPIDDTPAAEAGLQSGDLQVHP